MSDLTRDGVIHAALMTRTEAFAIHPREPDPWLLQFTAAFNRHLEDEAMRFIAANGCCMFLRNGEPCRGAESAEVGCDSCEATKYVAKADAEEARIEAKWKESNK